MERISTNGPLIEFRPRFSSFLADSEILDQTRVCVYALPFLTHPNQRQQEWYQITKNGWVTTEIM